MANDENNKKLNQDFALWKKPKMMNHFLIRQGKGRPMMVIECSAMVKDELGDTIDIHLGGSDLIFPIMRMKSLNQKQQMAKASELLVTQWDGQCKWTKMSKSSKISKLLGS